MASEGDTKSELLDEDGSGANASLGAVSGAAVDVTHETPAPVVAVVHPLGNPGAVTPSKAWSQTPAVACAGALTATVRPVASSATVTRTAMLRLIRRRDQESIEGRVGKWDMGPLRQPLDND